GDRSTVEHHRYRRVGRAEAARGTLPTDWKFERAGAVGIARGGATGESDRDGADRAAAPAIGGLHFERDGEARGGVVDFAGCGAEVRDRVGECGADSDRGD